MNATGEKRLDDLIKRARDGSRRALSRLVTTALSGLPDAAYSLPYPGQVVGVTGAPGVGKSSLLARLAGVCDGRAAVLAVDPVSPFSGGSFLADRIRMGEMPEEVFFRSLTSAHFSGGLARGMGRALRVLGAAGFRTVFVETVGSGQDEIEVHTLADTVLVVEAPGLGDDIQALKMGLLEIADIYVVNKGDQPGADSLAGYLEAMLKTSPCHCRVCRAVKRTDCGWTPPIVRTSATRGEGLKELTEGLSHHLKAHEGRRKEFECFRRLSEAIEEVDAAFYTARKEVLLGSPPPGASVPETSVHILSKIIRRLAESIEDGCGAEQRDQEVRGQTE